MPVKVLITTNIRSLGELMRQALRETGRYRAELADDSEQALVRAKGEQFSIAIIDFGAVPDPRGLVAELRDISAKIRIVAMPASADDQPSSQDRSVVDAWLSMPFYLPNLVETLADIAGDPEVGSSAASEPERLPFPSVVPKRKTSPQPAPEWLQDVNRVAQHLTRLSLESAAQAALITRGSQLWAYAGQLPQPAAEELARAVGHYWAHDGGSDLARFIRLDATNSEFMMYATSLGGDYVLALAFETEMPFTEMRTHAGNLARKLSSPPVDDTAARKLDSVPQQETVSEEVLPIADYAEEDLPPIPTDWRPDQDVAEGRQAFFEDLLASMDIPQPDTIEVDELEIPPQAEPVGDSIHASVASPTTEVDSGIPLPSVEELEAVLDLSLAETRPTLINETETLEKEKVPTEVEEPVVVLKPGTLEPDTSTLHNLTYACVLVPRLPQHHLVGDLATFLTQWVTQLSLAFGWRLEHLAIRPDYLHWIAVVPPNSSPGMMVHNIREETSQYVFSEFPRLARENPSGEFWTSGYLIVNGRDPFSRQMVQEFIGSVRTHQGAQ
ncbi:MAG: transposase [Anaerolineales bacterium]|nr:transposase [Chloroflexota bacterium]MBL6981731.1 transposase [Anaerolineales bacterium]